MSKPLPICPLVHGVWHAEQGSADYAEQIRGAFNELQPAGKSASALLGATVPLQFLSYFRDAGGTWVFDEEPLRNTLQVFSQLRRPLVFQLICNHLSRLSPLVRELRDDPRNLMAFSDGTHPRDSYFQTGVSPFTLEPDPEVPINHYRYLGLSRTLSVLREFNEQTGRVLGVTLFGEAHHLYDDFKLGGAAEGAVRITDYSPISVSGFQGWLARQFRSVLSDLNRAIGANFSDWKEIYPPENAKSQPAPLEYLDSYAHGKLPIEGWCTPAEQLHCVTIFVDDLVDGHAELGQNRPDVAEALEPVSELNTGFRYQLEFSSLKEGYHKLMVVGTSKHGKDFIIGERRFQVLCSSYSTGTKRQGHFLWARPKRRWHRKTRVNPTPFKYWLDVPDDDLDLIYNPLAALWFRYRQHQVEAYLEDFWRRAVTTGFPRDTLYSHQILIPFFGRRSEYLYATGETLRPNSIYAPGINLYGGQTVNIRIPRLIQRRPYAVTEFHPLSFKDKGLHLRALKFHREQEAAWVAPFFVSPFPPTQAEEAYRRFWIHPSNSEYGSDALHHAIHSLCNH